VHNFFFTVNLILHRTVKALVLDTFIQTGPLIRIELTQPGITVRLWALRSKAWGLNTGDGKQLTLLSVQTASGLHLSFSSKTGTKGSFAGGKAVGELSWQIASISCRGKEWVEPHFHSPICLHGEVVNQAQGHLPSCPFTFKLKITSIEIVLRSFARISIQWKYYVPTHCSRRHYEYSSILGNAVLWTDRDMYRCLGGTCASIFRVVQSGWLEAETSSKTWVPWAHQSTLHHIFFFFFFLLL
jgi:hypothetical protein